MHIPLNVLYEDRELIVVIKPAGIDSQSSGHIEQDMISLIKNHLIEEGVRARGNDPYVSAVHRLDKPVTGIMVYAKRKSTAAALSEQVRNGEIKKIYRAVITGRPGEDSGTLTDWILKPDGKNISLIVPEKSAGAKYAELSYRVLVSAQPDERYKAESPTLVEVDLMTGRHHQIRVQFASRGMPVIGDTRYGDKNQPDTPLALCSCGLSFTHPVTGERMEFSIEPHGGAFDIF